LIPGLRYNRYEMDTSDVLLLDVGRFGFDVVPTREENISANLGVLYDIKDALTIVMQYSEGFRPSNFDESNQAFVNRAFGYATVPNPDLRPEISEGLEIGVRSTRERARYGLTFYQNDYNHFIASQSIGHLRFGDNSSLCLGVYNLTDNAYARWANIQGLPASDTDAIARAYAPSTNFRISFNIDF
jgi:outer membrane receptor protein involved in Fe transport